MERAGHVAYAKIYYIFMWGLQAAKISRHRYYPTNAIVLTQRQYNIPKKNQLNEKLQSDSQSVGAILKKRQKYITSYILFLSLVYRPQNTAQLFLPNGARNLGLSKPEFGYRYYPTVSKMTPIGVIQMPNFCYNFRGQRPSKKN